MNIMKANLIISIDEMNTKETYSFGKRICELVLIGCVLDYWDHKFIIVTMSLNSFYHFHMSYLQMSKREKVNQSLKDREHRWIAVKKEIKSERKREKHTSE